jgi:mannosyl-oligosaccharide alpha-1,2-mannosidase
LAISVTHGKPVSDLKLSEKQMRDLDLAEEITRSCYEMYRQSTIGLSPESVIWKAESPTLGNPEALKVLNKHQSFLQNGPPTGTYASYQGTSKRLTPITRAQNEMDFDFNVFQSNNYLRPETIESIFILYRLTGKQEYRDMGWNMFQAFEKHTKVSTGGYSSLVMPAFF